MLLLCRGLYFSLRYIMALPQLHWIFTAFGIVTLLFVLITLSLAACSDPGIFPRYSEKQGENWRWSKQAQSYRPPGVVFCRESQLLVDDIDHFCPWTGTTIAKNNVCYFRCFVSGLCVLLTFVSLITVFGLDFTDPDKSE